MQRFKSYSTEEPDQLKTVPPSEILLPGQWYPLLPPFSSQYTLVSHFLPFSSQYSLVSHLPQYLLVYSIEIMADYTIEQGDTFEEVASKHGCSAEDIENANPGVNPNDLQVGQTIKLPEAPNGSAPAPAPTAPATSGDLPGGSGGSQGGGEFVEYSGSASNFPSEDQWAEYSVLWSQNEPLMKLHDSDEEIQQLKTAIETVAKEAGFDVRAILSIIMQESGGNVRVGGTNNGVNNPGIVSPILLSRSIKHYIPLAKRFCPW